MISLALYIQVLKILQGGGFRWTHPVVLSLGLLLLSSLALYLAANWFLRQSLPRRKGILMVEGIEGPVCIDRDRYGVPLIEAESVNDLLFGQGFVHAQDRLWQMELNRRVGAGRLAEIFGEDALEADIFLRRLGLRRAALADLEALSDQERAHLQAYCDGVNRAMAVTSTLPVEFRLLKFRPQPWELIDSLTWVQVMSMDLCSNWEQELLRGRIVEKLGPDGAELLHLFGSDSTLTVPPGTKGPEALKGLWELYDQAKRFLPNGGLPGGSNAWVVSGERSKSGKALLANDPHLVGRVPSVWYENQLRCPELDVQGASFAGVPFVVIGSNKRVSWGITNSFADTQDLFIEKFSSDNRKKYQTEDGWESVHPREELIAVKGGATHSEVVETTRHGPVLYRSEEYGLALKWQNFEPSNPLKALYDINRAESASTFKEALRIWQGPSSNFVFADADGHIGYLLAGHVPIRKSGTGLTPVPGWTGEYEWDGQIPFEELPQVDDPECGYVVTANNPVVGPNFPYHITWDWMGAARAERIEQLILEEDLHDLDSFQGMQVDTHCSLGLRFVDLCREMVLVNAEAKTARDILLQWDGDGHSESGEMALYEVTLMLVSKAIAVEALGEKLAAQFLGQSNNPVAIMAGHTGRYTSWVMDLLEQPDKYHRLRKFAPELPSMEVLVEEALNEAYVELRNAHGRDHNSWEWGKLHRIQFQHPLAINPVMSHFFSSPAGSAGGDTDTVFQTALNPQDAYDAEAWCPSFRHLVEMGDTVEYRSVLPTGQSGHPASRNYMDQFHLWCSGEMRPPGSRGKRRLELRPQ